jgi:5,10-methylenetetrahydrofolate reductase
MEAAKDKAAASIDIAARLIKGLKPLCNGIHLMPIGWDRMVPLVLDAVGL